MKRAIDLLRRELKSTERAASLEALSASNQDQETKRGQRAAKRFQQSADRLTAYAAELRDALELLEAVQRMRGHLVPMFTRLRANTVLTGPVQEERDG